MLEVYRKVKRIFSMSFIKLKTAIYKEGVKIINELPFKKIVEILDIQQQEAVIPNFGVGYESLTD